mmetsp:Transcript_53560/g.164725  ORF Transcript_53560/g.164725 Transcript_53560/m.164725 type:complete len:315 (+) Transcript_53560:277-1221(+)
MTDASVSQLWPPLVSTTSGASPLSPSGSSGAGTANSSGPGERTCGVTRPLLVVGVASGPLTLGAAASAPLTICRRISRSATSSLEPADGSRSAALGGGSKTISGAVAPALPFALCDGAAGPSAATCVGTSQKTRRSGDAPLGTDGVPLLGEGLLRRSAEEPGGGKLRHGSVSGFDAGSGRSMELWAEALTVVPPWSKLRSTVRSADCRRNEEARSGGGRKRRIVRCERPREEPERTVLAISSGFGPHKSSNSTTASSPPSSSSCFEHSFFAPSAAAARSRFHRRMRARTHTARMTSTTAAPTETSTMATMLGGS